MVFKTRTRRLAVALLVAAPLLSAVPASAAVPLHSVVSHDLISGSEGSRVTDPSCPWSSDFETPEPEARQTWQDVFAAKGGQETLYLSVCWVNTTANGGDGINGGSWTIARSDGTLSGTIPGGGETSNIVFSATLTAVSGTGSLAGVTGNLSWWSCGKHGAVRLQPKHAFSVCFSN